MPETSGGKFEEQSFICGGGGGDFRTVFLDYWDTQFFMNVPSV
jgi:hypothetical protein